MKTKPVRVKKSAYRRYQKKNPTAPNPNAKYAEWMGGYFCGGKTTAICGSC